MKYKKLIGLIVALVCFAVLLGGLLWSMFGGKDNSEGADNPSSQGDDNMENIDKEDNSPGELTPEENTAPDSTKPEDEEKLDGKQEQEKEDEKQEQEKEDEKKEDDSENKESNNSGPSNSTVNNPVVSGGKLNPDPKTKEEIEAVLNDPFMLLVNRESRIDKDFTPMNLVTYSGDYKLNDTCAKALRELIKAGKNAGYNYVLYSGYRTYSSQYNKYYNKIAYWKNQGCSEEEAIRRTNQYYAPPGASEHHTGLAADVCIPSIVNKYACLHEAYDQTEEFKWFSSHAHEYGFILRYDEGKEDITGYSYEPWHYRYVGVDVATEIYKRGITFEEYIADLKDRLAKLS